MASELTTTPSTKEDKRQPQINPNTSETNIEYSLVICMILSISKIFNMDKQIHI